MDAIKLKKDQRHVCVDVAILGMEWVEGRGHVLELLATWKQV